MIKNCLILSVMLCAAAIRAQPNPSISVTLDREVPVYKCGEIARLAYKVENLNRGTAEITIFVDGVQTIVTNLDLAIESAFSWQGTLQKPGFISASIYTKYDGKLLWHGQGAAFEPEKILPAVPPPADFMEFWRSAIAAAEKIPLDPKMEMLPKQSNKKFAAYAVSFAAPGGRVYGYLSIPQGKGPFPAEIQVPGAGGGERNPTYVPGFVTLIMNVHPYPVSPEHYQPWDDIMKDPYWLRGVGDRKTYAYHRIILGINRSIDWLAKQEFVDPARIHYYGFSQGGGLGIMLAALNKNFRCLTVAMPAFANHLGPLKQQRAGFPDILKELKNDPDAIRTAPYYDSANFARYITSLPVTVIVGFADLPCPAGTVYAVFNVMPAKEKKIINGYGCGHGQGPHHGKALADRRAGLLEKEP